MQICYNLLNPSTMEQPTSINLIVKSNSTSFTIHIIHYVSLVCPSELYICVLESRNAQSWQCSVHFVSSTTSCLLSVNYLQHNSFKPYALLRKLSTARRNYYVWPWKPALLELGLGSSVQHPQKKHSSNSIQW